jgi:hypothetical protein
MDMVRLGVIASGSIDRRRVGERHDRSRLPEV